VSNITQLARQEAESARRKLDRLSEYRDDTGMRSPSEDTQLLAATLSLCAAVQILLDDVESKEQDG
jgi:hypothetical protein